MFFSTHSKKTTISNVTSLPFLHRGAWSSSDRVDRRQVPLERMRCLTVARSERVNLNAVIWHWSMPFRSRATRFRKKKKTRRRARKTKRGAEENSSVAYSFNLILDSLISLFLRIRTRITTVALHLRKKGARESPTAKKGIRKREERKKAVLDSLNPPLPHFKARSHRPPPAPSTRRRP